MSRILVADDDAPIRELLRHALEMDGYEVVEAANGVETVKLFRENQIDLVITDIIMPEKEGLESIMDLKEIDPDVKIIAMSGGGRLEPHSYLQMAAKFGAKKVFQKPLSITLLLSTIKELLETK
ncbi:MAG: response regulator [Deltaproteobacteria bacterium]|nr:response regulator [Deltaproteobacteria bacterium]